jgi:phage shock protein PspC (stress-responsive transcriptional regulator)
MCCGGLSRFLDLPPTALRCLLVIYALLFAMTSMVRLYTFVTLDWISVKPTPKNPAITTERSSPAKKSFCIYRFPELIELGEKNVAMLQSHGADPRRPDTLPLCGERKRVRPFPTCKRFLLSLVVLPVSPSLRMAKHRSTSEKAAVWSS